MQTPLFSVVIPVYNKGPHIQRSVNSVLKQTCQDFEIILINDASTDNSLEEMQIFVAPNIRILHRDKPGPGGYAARNMGIEDARADWVAFLDADDEWLPEHLERMGELARKFPEVFFMGCGWLYNIEGSLINDSFFASSNKDGPRIIDVKMYLRLCLDDMRPVNTITACIKKTSLVTKNLFPDKSGAKRGGDLHAWLKMICRHGQMAWSNHHGAIYHRDSVNMVTKNSCYSFELMDKKYFFELSRELNISDKKLLARYLNKRMQNTWFGNLLSGGKRSSLFSKLYWKFDFFNSFFIFFISFVPRSVFFFLKYVKERII